MADFFDEYQWGKIEPRNLNLPVGKCACVVLVLIKLSLICMRGQTSKKVNLTDEQEKNDRQNFTWSIPGLLQLSTVIKYLNIKLL